MIVNNGFKRVRALVAADLDNGQAGTGTTLPTVNDTDLESGVADTDNTLSSVNESDNAISATHLVTTTEGNGSTLSEWKLSCNTDATIFNRVVKAGITKDNSQEITFIHNIVFEVNF